MTAATTETYAERAAKGAALLDAERPGWARKIDMEILDLSLCRTCILGQLFRGAGPLVMASAFDRARWSLFGDPLEWKKTIAHGFLLPFSEIISMASYEPLAAAWLFEIDRRVKGA